MDTKTLCKSEDILGMTDWSSMASDDNKIIIETKNIFVPKNNNSVGDISNNNLSEEIKTINKTDDIKSMSNIELLNRMSKISKHLKKKINKYDTYNLLSYVEIYIELIRDSIYELILRSSKISINTVKKYELSIKKLDNKKYLDYYNVQCFSSV